MGGGGGVEFLEKQLLWYCFGGEWFCSDNKANT